MSRRLGIATLVVDDYDRAIAWFRQMLGFVLIHDEPRENGKRWVVIAAHHRTGCALLLARAANEHQHNRIGDQTGGRVAFFLYTDNFEADYAQFRARGVVFTESPRQESYGRVCVFQDLYGNRWDLLESPT